MNQRTFALLTIAVSGVFAGGCAAESTESDDDVRISYDQNGNIQQPEERSDDAKDEKTVESNACMLKTAEGLTILGACGCW